MTETARLLGEIHQLEDAYRRTQGAEILAALKVIARSRSVYDGNRLELTNVLAQWSDPQQNAQLRQIDNSAALNGFFGEVDRRLHNFVASAKSLVEHTRPQMRQLLPGDLFEPYQDILDRLFIDQGVVKFVEDLRNYVLHRAHAPSTFAVTHTPDAFHAAVSLNRSTLLDWDRWNAASNRWLRSQPEQIDLEVVLADYCHRVDEISDSIVRLVRAAHPDEIAAAEDIARRRDAFWADLLSRETDRRLRTASG